MALLLGRHRVAMALAGCAGAMELTVLAFGPGTAWRWLDSGWLLVTIPFLLALLVAAHGRRPAAVLGRRGTTYAVTGLVLAGMSGGFPYVLPGSGVRGVITVVMLVVGAALLLLGLRRTDPDTRPPLLAALAALAALAVGQPALEQALDMPLRWMFSWDVFALAAAMLVGLPLAAAALVRGVLALPLLSVNRH